MQLLVDLGATFREHEGPSSRVEHHLSLSVGDVTSLASETSDPEPRHPDADWAASGAMALTGEEAGPPLVAPGSPATAARGATLAIHALTDVHPDLRSVAVDGALLLGERAAIAGLGRRGSVAPGGSCRLVATRDGWLAVNLPRSSDLELVPAWLEVDVGPDPWPTVAEVSAGRSTVHLVERAALLGLPVARVPQPAEVGEDEQGRQRHGRPAGPTSETSPVSAVSTVPPWRMATDHTRCRSARGRDAGGREARSRDARSMVSDPPGLVVDLSSMWAGPLCANLLGLAGFRVVKIESSARPDGARLGPPAFFDLLHGGHESVVVDLDDPDDREALGRLLVAADVVIESSRPRALDHLDLGPATILARAPDLIWVSITGYGRTGPWQNRVAFGDDATAAAGMIVSDPAARPMFCGDAMADPLTGMHAALVTLAQYAGRRGGLVDVALRDVVASTLRTVPVRPAAAPAARSTPAGWVLDTPAGPVAVGAPRARPAGSPARAAGADTDAVLGRFRR
jgi:crotonobetainyl-CoA:carnitine CoA-transferase CaiB-like acyl-CoA transferase